MSYATKAIFFACLLAFATPGQACMMPPSDLTKHHRDLVADSRQIALARALEPEASADGPGRAVPRFETVEVLKGDIAPEFSLQNGRYLIASQEPDDALAHFGDDFNGHRDVAVWDRSLTRQWNEPDCSMAPRFKPGETYLIFADHPHWRAYELIRSADDLWLMAVRNLIEHPERHAGLTVTVTQWLLLAGDIFVVQIGSCEDQVIAVMEILAGNSDGLWPPSPDSSRWYYGKDRACERGKRYLVVADRAATSLQPVGYKILDVDEGAVDFTAAIEGDVLDGTQFGGTELEVNGSRIWQLEELESELSRLQQP